MLWTSLVISTGVGLDFFLSKRQRELREKEHGKNIKNSTSTVDEDDYEDVNGSSMRLNGEEVRKAMEGWQFRELIRAGISGLAFFMGIVGIWGDCVVNEVVTLEPVN